MQLCTLRSVTGVTASNSKQKRLCQRLAKDRKGKRQSVICQILAARQIPRSFSMSSESYAAALEKVARSDFGNFPSTIAHLELTYPQNVNPARLGGHGCEFAIFVRVS